MAQRQWQKRNSNRSNEDDDGDDDSDSDLAERIYCWHIVYSPFSDTEKEIHVEANQVTSISFDASIKMMIAIKNNTYKNIIARMRKICHGVCGLV